MRLIIELENGERFEPSEIDWANRSPDGAAKLLFKQMFHDIGVIPQTRFSAQDFIDARQVTADYLAFLNKVGVTL